MLFPATLVVGSRGLQLQAGRHSSSSPALHTLAGAWLVRHSLLCYVNLNDFLQVLSLFGYSLLLSHGFTSCCYCLGLYTFLVNLPPLSISYCLCLNPSFLLRHFSYSTYVLLVWRLFTTSASDSTLPKCLVTILTLIVIMSGVSVWVGDERLAGHVFSL